MRLLSDMKPSPRQFGWTVGGSARAGESDSEPESFLLFAGFGDIVPGVNTPVRTKHAVIFFDPLSAPTSVSQIFQFRCNRARSGISGLMGSPLLV